MTETKIGATSPKAVTTRGRSYLTRLVLDIDDYNTAFTRWPSIDPSLEYFDWESVIRWLSLVAQTRTTELRKDALAEGGSPFAPIDRETVDPLSVTAIKYQTMLDNSLNTEEAARILGMDAEGIVRRLTDRTLYGVPTKDGWKIPGFQFEDDEPLPGLESVLPLLHDDLHPIAVQNWFTSPNTDLLIRDEEVSPRQWLLSGRDPDDVARIAIDV